MITAAAQASDPTRWREDLRALAAGGAPASKSATAQLLHAALEYAERGWLVLPLHTPTARGCSCGRADCASAGKHPRTEHGSKDASRDPATIRAWWRRWPDANVGIATGPESGSLVLDVDGVQGESSLAAFEKEHGALPDTFTVRTGSGGQHIYFAWPEGADVRNSARKIAPGLDVRGVGGLVAAPPSLHKSGRRYEATDSTNDPAPCPAKLLALVLNHERTSAQTGQPAPAATEIRKGQRTPVISALIGKLHSQGVPVHGIEAAALGLNATFNPPHPEEKIRAMVADITRRYQAGSPPKEEAGELHPLRGTEIVERNEPMVLPDHIPDQTIIGVHGRPGDGKTTAVMLIAASLARGHTPYAGTPCPPRDVLVMSNEDSPSRIRKLFAAAGGDVTRLWVENCDDLWQLPDLPRLEAAISAHSIGCVIVDSLASHSGKADLNSHQDTAQLLVPLRALAGKYRCVVLVVHHLNKQLTPDHIAKVAGSIGITASFRHNLHVVPDPENSDLRLLVNGKSNLVPPNVPALRFRFSPLGWQGESNITIAQVYAQNVVPEEEGQGKAVDWLRDALSDGEWRDTGDLIKQAKSEFDLSRRSLFRAAERLKVERRKEGFGGHADWRLPMSASTDPHPQSRGTHGTHGTNGNLKDLQAPKNDISPIVPIVPEQDSAWHSWASDCGRLDEKVVPENSQNPIVVPAGETGKTLTAKTGNGGYAAKGEL